MTITLAKVKNRRESGPFVPLPCNVLNHENYVSLSSKAKALLLDLCSQVRFKKGGPINNGDLCATPSVMLERGWKSKESLGYALQELLHYQFIIISRKGDRKRCHLYAITWWAINECNGKLDIKETVVPYNFWKEAKTPWVRPRRKPKLKSVPRFAENKGRYTGDKYM